MIVYIILAHKDPAQLHRLVRVLATPESYFFIHIDAKSDIVPFLHLFDQKKIENVQFVTPRINVHWGAFSIVKATYAGMQAAINSKIDFSHIILLSGQDYPIKSNQYIHDFLARNKEREFIAFYPIPNNFWTNQGLDRIQSFHFLEFKNAYLIKGLRRISSVFSKIYRRKFPKELHPYGGPAWWCLTQKCVKFLLGYAQTNRSIIRFFKFVKFPDEIFFQTVVCNSIFAPNVQNSSLTYVNWTNSSDLIVLGIDNFDSLKASDKLFARKFDPKFDPNIFDKLDHENQAIRD